VAKYDLIVEGKIVEITSATVSLDRCYAISELTIGDITGIVGEVSDNTMTVRSWATVGGGHEANEECFHNHVGEGPLPNIGARGLLLLTCNPHEVDTRSVPGGFATLSSPRYEFLARDKKGHVNVYLRGFSYAWAYDEFVSNLRREGAALALDGLAIQAPIVAVGMLGSYEERSVDQNSVRYPLTIERVFKGRLPGERLFLAAPFSDPPGPAPASVTEGIVNRNFTERVLKPLSLGQFGSNRIVIMGKSIEGDDLMAIPFGCMSVDAEGFIRTIYGVDAGKMARNKIPLAQLEEDLK
jgi:hypothetical protein